MKYKTLKDIRTKNNFTMRQVATKLGMSESGYCLYEKGVRTPNAEKMLQLSKILNVSVEEIVNCFVKGA